MFQYRKYGEWGGRLNQARKVWGRLSEGIDNQAERDMKSKLALLGKRWWG